VTSLREKLIKIGAKVASHGRYVTFQMAEGAANSATHSPSDKSDIPIQDATLISRR
jgi:hypothetical protein